MPRLTHTIGFSHSGHAAGVQHSTVQHLALGLLAQLMQKSTISTQVAKSLDMNVCCFEISFSILDWRSSLH